MTTSFIYDAQEHDIYIGNDVDSKKFSLNIRERYRQVMTKTIPANPEELYNFTQRQFPGQRVVIGYEAGPTGFGLYDCMVRHNVACVLISPSSVPKASNQKVKTNRIDARKLASMLAEGDFKPVRVPEGEYRELRHLIQIRENYARGQRTAKQRIKALLLYTGMHVDGQDTDRHWSNLYIQYLRKLECSAAIKFRLERLLEDLDYSRQQLTVATHQLRKFCTDGPAIKEHIHNLKTIPGIGLITAATVLGRIGDPRNLRGIRELSAFCGIIPRENSTGDKVNRGSITHLGNGPLRALLIEAAWRSIRDDTELEQFFHRIVSRNQIKYAKQKAIVAVAHKLTLRIYRVLVDRREYRRH